MAKRRKKKRKQSPPYDPALHRTGILRVAGKLAPWRFGTGRPLTYPVTVRHVEPDADEPGQMR